MTNAPAPATDRWQLHLYVSDETPKSLAALANLRYFCQTHLAGRYKIELIDLLKHPKRAVVDQILAIPTLVCTWPQPIRRVIGDLSNEARVLAGLHLRAP
jgi:circadian clock protein KaiB